MLRIISQCCLLVSAAWLTSCSANINACDDSTLCSTDEECIHDNTDQGIRCQPLYGSVIIAGGGHGQTLLSTTEAIGTDAPPTLPESLYGPTLTAVGTTLYYCGGWKIKGDTNSCYTFNTAAALPLQEWSPTVRLPAPMSDHTAIAVESHIWFIDSYILYDLDTQLGTFNAYDMPISSSRCAVGNKTHRYVIGGFYDNEVLLNTDATKPGDWQKVITMAARRQCSCLMFGPDIYVTGGRGMAHSKTVEVLDTVTYNVSKAGGLIQGRFDHKMVVIAGKPAVIGGEYFDADRIYHSLDSIETYDILSGQWQAHSHTLQSGRDAFGAVQLADSNINN